MEANANTAKLQELGKKKPINALKASPAASTSTSKTMLASIKSKLPEMPSKNTMLDVALFGAAVFVVVRHGKDIAKMVESLCPDEQQIMAMMQEQEAMQMGAPGPM